MNEEYLARENDLLLVMRLIVEGAVNMFENEAQPLYRLGIKNDKQDAAMAFDMVGVALGELKRHICELQAEHSKAYRQQGEA